MIIGTSMGLETCLILGRVSHNLPYWKKKLLTDIPWCRGDINEKTAYIQARSSMARAMEVLENTPAVLSLGKLCHENGFSYEWINGQKPHLIKNGIRNTVQHGELRSDHGSRLVNEFFFQFSSFSLNDTFKTREKSSYIFLKFICQP